MNSLVSRLTRSVELMEQGRADGLHIGVQLYLSLAGEDADLVLGESRPGVPMTAETLMLWLSCTKPIAAAAILQLIERGLLNLDDTVGQHLPAFAVNGKEGITIRHLLTHTGGFRWIDVGWPVAAWHDIIERICQMRLERGWIPGERAGYHPYTSWYILGELVRVLDGRPFAEYVREEIFLPLGMPDCWIGMPGEVFDAYGTQVGELQNTERPGQPPYRWSSREGASHCAPGGNGQGPVRQLARFYQMLLAGGERHGQRILTTDSVQQITSRQRVGMFDETFKHTMDWGLGMILNSNRYGVETVPYGFGRHASDDTFGHGGNQSSVALADPLRQLIVTLVFNGTAGEARHQTRVREVLSALYEDLGLVG